MLEQRWDIYKSVHVEASKHTFYAGAIATVNELIPMLRQVTNGPPPDLIRLFEEINTYMGKEVIPILKDDKP